MRFHWRPSITAYAHAQDAVPQQPHHDEAIAPRDAGWAELWTADGSTRLGRGHLMIWADAAHIGTAVTDSGVHESSAQPLGEDAPDLMAELRSYTAEGMLPEVGARLLVAPEQSPERYTVVVKEAIAEDGDKGVIALDWPDNELPAALAELGGH